jgi:hypothetical protein
VKYDQSKNKHASIAELDQTDLIAWRRTGERYSPGLPFALPVHSRTGCSIAHFGIIYLEHRDHRQQIDRQERPMGHQGFFKIAFIPGFL